MTRQEKIEEFKVQLLDWKRQAVMYAELIEEGEKRMEELEQEEAWE